MRLVECTPLSDYYAGILQETPPRKTAENTVNHRGGGVGLVIANHRGGGRNSVTVTRLELSDMLLLTGVLSSEAADVNEAQQHDK